ncbi:hypothetical protein ABB27_16145 [Stenotrophomonas terrae]|uniref:Transmembrane protein n=2 Tax=Stenotrophomonas terrae TaxID=405446 RepID=A0A0R0CFR3_9GAMM|nr:hypothetical protein ABB27_16145 [Stenotrophomonas terrae]
MQQRGVRSLQMLAGNVGAGFRRRALLPAVFYLVMAVLVLITAWAGRALWPQLAPLVLLLCAAMMGRMRSVRRRWLGVYLSVVVLLLLLQLPWSGLQPAGVQRVALVAMALALAQVLIYTVRLLRLAQTLQLQADDLEDAAILALLPPQAAEDARQWLAGDERKTAELSEVVSLSVLYATLQSPGVQRRRLRRVLPG